MSIPLLKTKLHIPRPKAGTVTRPRLTQKLTDSSQGTAKLALIVAPAGFGKTTLLSAWHAANPDHPVAWLSLDDDDNDPSRFWSYTAALETFTHVFVISYLDRSHGYVLRVRPPWREDHAQYGLFATRSPNRPSPIGLTQARVLRVEGNRVITSPLDLFDGTPILDLKPLIRSPDGEPPEPQEAADVGNDGWLAGSDHLELHRRRRQSCGCAGGGGAADAHWRGDPGGVGPDLSFSGERHPGGDLRRRGPGAARFRSRAFQCAAAPSIIGDEED